jgi:acyl dehydratase
MIKFWEDFNVGEESLLGSHLFTRDEIVAYASAFDPQRFHLDEEAAKASIFGGLCASGWHTGCVAMRIIIDSRDRIRAEAMARGEAVPQLGVSPGFVNMRWPTPTRPGDTITFSSRVLSKRETKRPQWGLVALRTTGVNQNGLEAISFESQVFVARREAD